MRLRLCLLAAAAPLAFAPAAFAQTTVSTTTSTPLATASSGDVTVAAGGAITVTTATPAITLNSNNAVSVAGSVGSDNVSGATGVLLQGGAAGSLTTTGSISVTEDFSATDTVNADGVVEAPFAQGTGRYGVRLTGTAPFTGAIALDGATTVKGQGSYGVSLEAPLIGSLTTLGAVALTGDSGAGVRETGGVSGEVAIGGGVSVLGQNSSAVVLAGDVGGALRLGGAVSATGYSTITRLADAAQTKVQATAADVEQAGSAVVVAANVAGGVYLSAPPTGTVSGTLADVDGDGVADGSETTGSISQTGSAPALAIGSTTGGSITLGAFGAGDNAYGLVNRGAITAAGLEDGVAATAVQIGASGGAVALAGGVRNVGTIDATSYEANATGLHVLAGASVPTLRNEGSLSANVLDSTLTTTNAVATSAAIQIDAGAAVGSLVNTGSIVATAKGDAMSTYAVVDRSGGLFNILNEGGIGSLVSPVTAGDALSGRSVALDLSSNTSGVTLVQQPNPVTTATVGSTSGTADTTTIAATTVAPSIAGDILLGSGPNTVQFLGGAVVGALDMGTGSGSSLLIGGGATYIGALTGGGGALALTVSSGSLTDLNTGAIGLSSLAIGSTGVLTVSVDAAHASATRFDVAGPATVAAGGAIAVRLVTAPTTTAQSFVLIDSPQLTVAQGAALTGVTSYLFQSSFAADPNAGTLTLTLSRKADADLGLIASETASLDAVLAGVAANTAVSQALLAPTTKADFTKAYDQLLPEHGGGVFLAAREAAESIGRAVSDRYETANSTGAWVQEFGIGFEQSRDTALAEHGSGFGFAGGFETADSQIGALGVSAAFVDANISSPDVSTDSSSRFDELEGGLYWRLQRGGLLLTARGAGGYLFGHEERDVAFAATTGSPAVALMADADWHGWTADGRLGAAYQFNLGRFFVRPQLAAEYFRLDQDSYSETGSAGALSLDVDGRSGHAAIGTASMVFGGRFGSGITWRPTVELGVRDVFSGDAGDTTARFAAGGDPFTLVANPITGTGGIATVGIRVGSPIYEVYFDAHGEDYPHYREGDLRLGVKVAF
ncbi:MAG: autotransporter outer membrane beta-barrel domain-containing protein [Caulobacteraceae bacterium]|nr:autotransporter outer membrane beta-barrel domain-containing protein [Caulobacter sp.]